MRVRRQRCEEPCFAPSVIWSTISYSTWRGGRTKNRLSRKPTERPVGVSYAQNCVPVTDRPSLKALVTFFARTYVPLPVNFDSSLEVSFLLSDGVAKAWKSCEIIEQRCMGL